MTTSEEWRPVVGYEGLYEVSSEGRVRRLDRVALVHTATGAHPRMLRGQLMATAIGRYERVNLTIGRKSRSHLVHRVVAAAFLGPCPDGHVVCHNNGDALDNRPSNLRYDTAEGNMRDAVAHGTHVWARRTHCINGHEWTPENVRIDRTTGARRCRSCAREKSARLWAARKAG